MLQAIKLIYASWRPLTQYITVDGIANTMSSVSGADRRLQSNSRTTWFIAPKIEMEKEPSTQTVPECMLFTLILQERTIRSRKRVRTVWWLS